jgi:hypothetical protein
MSTDYGLKCIDCNKSICPDNLGEYAVHDALKAISALANLRRAISAVSSIGVLDVEVSAYWCPQMFNYFLDWALEHHQHKLVVVDEYGKEYPAAPKRV